MRKKKKISLMCTAFRDGFQSVFGARVLSKDYLPVVKEAVRAGLTNIEAGGGASFQAAFFYNNENAFDVMDSFREICGPDVNLQTLARGVNVVALDSQSSEMIKLHAELFKKHGMSTIRNFDALNDPENLLYSAECIKNAGLKHQLCVAMMSLPPACKGAHTPDFYEDRLKKFIKAGIPFDSLCFKDASGTSVPAVVYETIQRARKLVGKKVPIEFHSHDTAGAGLACYLAAVDGGADIVDLSMSPVSGGTCQPDIATMWHALRETQYELDCDVDAVMKVEDMLQEALKDYFIPPEALHVDPRIPWSPMPGGALTANTQMLRDNNLMDKYAEIIIAMEEVVRKGGFGTSVTPVSQFYFQQAFNNVMFGKWQKIADGYGKMVLGYFGKTPVKPDSEVVKIASEQLGLKPTKESVLSINDKNEKKSRSYYTKQLENAGLPITDENVFIAAACGDKGLAFLQGKGKIGVRYKEKEVSKTKAGDTGTYNITLNGEVFKVELNGSTAVVNGETFNISDISTVQNIAVTPKNSTSLSQTSSSIEGGSVIKAPTPGTITKVLVQVGQQVQADTDICIVEVMKMETFVKAGTTGTIKEINVQPGTQVTAGQQIAKTA
ncbi:MAG: biotin attachment protein [Alphaproteobacteria bacterium]|nr:biotin attachment protein [Alphaproteobacteria bacterium]MBR3912781.1 biotin attachment protein [Alphaproteobacteria bacterium]